MQHDHGLDDSGTEPGEDDLDWVDADFEDPEWVPPEPKPVVAARLVDLVFLLSRKECRLDEIRERFAAMGEYRGSVNTARQKFRRDCAKLRALGIDVVERDDAYRIPSATTRSMRRLTAEEATAVALACKRVLPSVSAEVRRALGVGLAKIGATASLDAAPWESRVPAPATLLPVLAACRTRALRIGYTNAAGEHSTRVVHPWAVRCTEDCWYVRAWDERTDSARTFKLDRIDPGPELLGPATSVVAPDDLASAVSDLESSPWEWGDAEPHEVTLRLDGSRPDRLLPEGAVLDDEVDGEAPTARMLVRDDDNFATTVMRLGEGVTVVAPAVTREAVASRLDAAVATHRGDAAPVPELSPHVQDRPSAADDLARTERLLRLIGIAHAPGDEAAHFDPDALCRVLQCSTETLRDDMALLTHWCGVPPFLAGDMVSAMKVRGEVSLVSASLPLVESLTEWEAAALAAAARLAMEVEPDTGVRDLLAGILDALGVEADAFPVRNPHVDVVAADGTSAGALATAIRGERRCEIVHETPGRGPARARTIDPWRLGNSRGRLYLSAFDHDTDAVRMFRVDRIASVRVLDEEICHPQDVDIAPDSNRIVGPGDVKVVVAIPADHVAWATGRYGTDAVSVAADGGHHLVLPTGDVDRLAPTLLALTPRCEVVAPPEARAAVVSLARRLRDRYR